MYPYLLQQLLTEGAATFSDRTALSSGAVGLSYTDLDMQSSAVAAVLAARGVARGDRVGILLEKSIASVVSIFAILKAGGVYVPLDPRAPPSRLVRILERCHISCLISSGKEIERILRSDHTPPPMRLVVLVGSRTAEGDQRFGGGKSVAWEEAVNARGEVPAFAASSDQSPAYILHTSGSTGVPKGVVLSHHNALTFVRMAKEFFRLTESDRVASQASLAFDLSVFDVFCAVMAGATIVLVPDTLTSFPARLAEFIDDERISVWNSVASILNMLAERGCLDRFSFDHLRLVHFSGDLLPMKYLRILRAHMRSADFFNIYGQTEANSSMYFAVGDLPDDDAWRIPIGIPFPNFEVFALDESGRTINRAGDEGELYVNSGTVALGYWDDEEGTTKRFVPDPRGAPWRSCVYRTGDLVRLDGHGNYVYVGRTDNMVKSRGNRVELNETELAMRSHPLVSEAVALALPDVVLGSRIVACVSLREGELLAVEALKAHCGTIVPQYMVPEEIVVLSDMPRTTTGKIDREALRAQHFCTSPSNNH
jgi:amino acid adenylation domain-containing protein